MIKVCNHRKSANDLRNKSIRSKILSLNILQKVLLIYLLLVLSSETDHLRVKSLGDTTLDALKCTTADEENILSVDM